MTESLSALRILGLVLASGLFVAGLWAALIVPCLFLAGVL